MNLLKHILLLFTLFFIIQVKAQSVIGVELNINKDYFNISDPGQKLDHPKAINVSFGFSYKYIFRKGVTVYTGIGLKPYNDYIYFKDLLGSNSSGNMALQIPLVFGYRFPLIKETLFFSPLAGFAFNYLLFETGSTGSGIMVTSSDTLGYFSSITYANSYFPTVTIGFMVELMLGSRFSLALSSQLNKGFNTISTQNIDYFFNSNPIVNASQTSDGSYYTLLALKVNYHFKRRKV